MVKEKEKGNEDKKGIRWGKVITQSVIWLTLLFVIVFGIVVGMDMYKGYIKEDSSVSEFHKMIENEKVEEVTYYENIDVIDFTDKEGSTYGFKVPERYYDVNEDKFEVLESQGVEVLYKDKVNKLVVAIQILSAIVPFILVGILVFIVVIMVKGMATDNVEMVEDTGVKLEDVAGYKEVKKEIMQIIRFIRGDKGVEGLTDRIPKGILLEGDPGNGKTLWAKALAGESGVPFYYMSASEIEGMFVGQGSMKVKSIFKSVRKGLNEHGKAILFLDEIDSVGLKRENRSVKETGQTINQLLTELDGLKDNGKLLVMGATNLASELDSALTRAGRFDRVIHIPKPGREDREAILHRYVEKKSKQMEKEVFELDYISVLADQTQGMSGADLELLISDAGLIAVEREKETIGVKELRESYLRQVMGLPKGIVFNKETERILAYHEAAHAVEGMITSDRGYKSIAYGTIEPYGQAGGHIAFVEGDKVLYRKSDIEDKAKVLLAGRVMEEDILDGDYTSGAQNDLMRVNELVHKYVVEFGMSEEFPHVFEDGRWGDWNQEWIKEETRRIRGEWYKEAKEDLMRNREDVEVLAKHLMEYKSIDVDEISRLFGEKYPSRSGKDGTE